MRKPQLSDCCETIHSIGSVELPGFTTTKSYSYKRTAAAHFYLQSSSEFLTAVKSRILVVFYDIMLCC